MKISVWCAAGGLLLVAGCGKNKADDGPSKDAATATTATTYAVADLVAKMRTTDAPPTGTKVRVTGKADDHVTFGFNESHTRLDILPETKDAGSAYVMCVGSSRREMTLDAVRGQAVTVEGTLATGGLDFPVLRPCRVVSP